MDFGTLGMIVLMGAALYFLMIRPQQKRAKEQKSAMDALAEGSRIMTVSGILGTVKHLGEKQAVIEVSPGVEMTIDKRAISPQPVEDEFEYADEDSEAAPVVETAAIEAPVVDPEPAETPVEDGGEPIGWENPATDKN